MWACLVIARLWADPLFGQLLDDCMDPGLQI